LVKEKALDF
jgi:hypothetical protein